MMAHNLDLRVIQMLYTDARFASLLNSVDRLHDAVSEGQLEQVTTLSKDEIVGWLRDILFTVNETINELESTANPVYSFDRFVAKVKEGGCNA